MLSWFISLILTYKYPLLLIVAIPEGPIIMLLSGAFIKLGFLSFWPAYICLMIGDMIADIMWYWIGYFGGMRFVDKAGKYFGITRHKVEIVSKFFHKYHETILFISKITTGFGFALITLITAGLVKIPFKRYFILNLLGGFIWAGLLISLGYTFQHLYITIDNILGRITIIGVSAIIIILIINIGLQIRKKIEKS